MANPVPVLAADGTGTKELGAATAGKRWGVYGWWFESSASATVQFKSGTTALSGAVALGLSPPMAPFPPTPGDFYFVTAVGEALNLAIGAAAVDGAVWVAQLGP